MTRNNRRTSTSFSPSTTPKVPMQTQAGSDMAPIGSVDQLSFEMVMVTPDLAQAWLDGMSRNRNVRKARVVEFSRDMIHGRWHPTGEALKFDTNGNMVDGQHRCEAVVLAGRSKPGISVPMLVVRGVPPEAQQVMDTNTRRTAADQLKIAGFDNYNLLSASAKWCVIYQRRALYADRMLRSVTHAEILTYVNENPRLVEICRETAHRLNNHIDMPGGYIGAAYYICWKIEPEVADEFFHRWADGVMLGELDPILALKSRLRELKEKRISLPGEQYLSLVFRTWNHKREGNTLSNLPLYKDKMPIRCPDPK